MNIPHIQVYQAKDGFRWRLIAGNARLVAESGEAYTRKADAGRAADDVISLLVLSRWPVPIKFID